MRVAILEDEMDAVNTLKAHFDRYSREQGCEFVIDIFENAINFITAYRPDYDLVLFDIEMPLMNGMEGAHKLREIDPYVPIVFVTNMAQYAVQGYSVGAMDFIVKPVGFFSFETMLSRIRRSIAAVKEWMITVSSAGIMRNIPSSRIKYVEVYRKKLTFHTLEGNIESWGSLSDIADQLPADSFSKCNNSYLVNLKYVDCVVKEEVLIGNDRLPISHLRRKEFVAELSRYFGRRK